MDGRDEEPDSSPLEEDSGTAPLTSVAPAPLRRPSGCWRSAVLVLPLLAVCAWTSPRGAHEEASLRLASAGDVQGKVAVACPDERGVDYWTHASLYEVQGVGSKQLCVEKCSAEASCGAWTWGEKRNVQGLSDVCFLKALGKRERPTKHHKEGVVSGLRPGSACDEHQPAVLDNAGWVKNKHGICLSAPESGMLGEKVHMSSCDISNKNQLWVFEKTSGHIRMAAPRQTHGGDVCLTAKAGSTEFSMVLIEKCDNSHHENQQWSYSEHDSQVVLWKGLCLNAPEPASDSSSVDMRGCDSREEGQRWAVGKEIGRLYYDDRSYKNRTHANEYQSIFCFALMLPGGYEQELITWQAKRNISLFACDDYAVYSNKAIDVINGVQTRKVDSTLKCEKGGEFQTALNLPIFLVVWTKVIEDGQFMKSAWTVKVDPDTVFVVPRLRAALQAHPETEDGVYINNCKYGLHGPLEVFSRNAVKAWAMGSESCVDHFTKLCSGDCAWGEDMFIDQCLSRVLKLQRDSDFRLLVEDHCDPPDGWKSCGDGSYASYHPFKSVSEYEECFRSATHGDLGEGA